MAPQPKPAASETPSISAQSERAEGRFELRIRSAPEHAAGWRSLRRALGLSRADLAWLRDRVPGVVRRGARSDLLPLLERVRAAGHEGALDEKASPEQCG